MNLRNKFFCIIAFTILALALVIFKPKAQSHLAQKYNTPLIPEGTILSCPGNNQPMYEVMQDIYQGSIVFKPENFKSLHPEAKLMSGEKVPCGLFKGWVRCVHTTKGWIPKDCML